MALYGAVLGVLGFEPVDEKISVRTIALLQFCTTLSRQCVAAATKQGSKSRRFISDRGTFWISTQRQTNSTAVVTELPATHACPTIPAYAVLSQAATMVACYSSQPYSLQAHILTATHTFMLSNIIKIVFLKGK